MRWRSSYVISAICWTTRGRRCINNRPRHSEPHRKLNDVKQQTAQVFAAALVTIQRAMDLRTVPDSRLSRRAAGGHILAVLQKLVRNQLFAANARVECRVILVQPRLEKEAGDRASVRHGGRVPGVGMA